MLMHHRYIYSRAVILAVFFAITACCFVGCTPKVNTSTELNQIKTVQDLPVGRAITKSLDENQAWPTYTWWTVFHDSQLNHLVSEALHTNPSLLAAKIRVNRAENLVNDWRSILLPSTSLSSLFTGERFTKNQFYRAPYAGNFYWNNMLSSSLSFNPDFWGENRATFLRALDLKQVVQAEQKEAELTLQTAIVRCYIRLCLSYCLHDIAEQTLTQRSQIFSLTQQKFAAGMATQIQLSQAQTPISVARGALEESKASITLAKHELSELLGKGPGTSEVISRPTLSFHEHIGLPVTLPFDLISRRPDIVARKWMIDASHEQIQQAKAAFYPNINLRVLLGFQSIGFSNLLTKGSLTYGLAPAIHLPLFDGGHLESQLGIAHSAYALAVQAYNQRLIHALHEIASHLVELQSLEKQRIDALEGQQLAQHALEIALKAYHAGLTNHLSVLHAEQESLLQSNRCAQVEAKYLDAYALLMQSLGGGVDEHVSNHLKGHSLISKL